MNPSIEIKVPDIGNFKDVAVIDVLVKVGDRVNKNDPLITLESDKAAMDIPCPMPGVVEALKVKVGDKVSEGSPILLLVAESDTRVDTAGIEAAVHTPPPSPLPTSPFPPPHPSPLTPHPSPDLHAQLLVLGAGPGGYTAAFRAADLGLRVVLVERYPTLGGVCLNVGCIPSKALLHAARVIAEAEEMAAHGLAFGRPQIDLERLRDWKAKDVVGRLTGGLAQLARQRQVTVVQGVGRFTGPHQMEVAGAEGVKTIAFDHAIIAAGSRPIKLPFQPDDPRVMDSTGALELADVPGRLLIIGGGIIGLEMGTVYDALGSRVTVVELGGQLIPGCDPDLVRPLAKRLEKRFAAILLQSKVTAMEAHVEGIEVTIEGGGGSRRELYDRVLVAIGRRPNGDAIGAEAAGVKVDERGFIPVDRQMRTNVPHILAIGDIVGPPMLAHKAVHEGKLAAEVIAGHKVEFQALAIPAVAYTDPEVAWAGLTETEAQARGIAIDKAVFPWAASGRALSLARTEGLTKLILEPDTRRVLGAGIVGVNAGELIAEAVLAIEMGATAEDLALTIHAHPTLSETVCFAAELAEGSITDLMPPRRKK
ncbi:MAG: dihydrolipoyl dehydrogenase [Thiobacillaceae bacterium]|nr:dihydrolipoyl dehydrogenase [Thiobacillaceae bacterium]